MAKTKRKEELSHPKMVRFMKVFTTLFMIGTFAFNAYIGYAGMSVDWGFYPDKTTPSIQNSFNNVTNEVSIYIPVYVNNSGPIGFPIQNLSIDFNIYNTTSLIANETNTIGTIPHGTGEAFNVTMIKADALALFLALNASAAIRMEILFTISYAVTSVQLNVSIDLPGGLSF